MKTFSSVFVVAAIVVVTCFSNQNSINENKLVLGDPPVIIIPPVKAYQDFTTTYQLYNPDNMSDIYKCKQI